MEPASLLPKLPIMLLNGAEGIGTGFSSVIPSFNHKQIIASMISCIEKEKPKKIKPWVRYFSETIEVDPKGKITFPMGMIQKGESYIINELPKGYDSKKIYKYLSKLIDNDVIKDYTDSSVDNKIEIELLFKRGQKINFKEFKSKYCISSSVTPNYTLISERGVKVLDKAEEIIEIFTLQRLKVVKRRYELLIEDAKLRLEKNDEIIRFIKERHYAQAEKKENRAAFIKYLENQKFKYSEYLSDMAIYRMTKEEVQKRQLFIQEDKKNLKEYKKILASKSLIKKVLIDELNTVDKNLSAIMSKKEKAKETQYSKVQKIAKKTKKKTRRI
jgi:DNA gyrase subunit A